jgi:hypothetical protein
VYTLRNRLWFANMSRKSPRNRRAVSIVELPEFEASSQRLLDPNTLRALHLLLADNPLAGSKVAGYSGLLELKFAGFRILYSVGTRFTKVFLIRLLEPGETLPSPTSDEGKTLRKALDVLVKGGLVLAAKELLKAAWELLRDGFF